MIILHDKRLPAEYKKALSDNLHDVFFVSFEGIPGNVYDSISSHPDIYIFQLDEKTVVHAPGVPEEKLKELRESGIELVIGEEDPHGRYPQTARYNAARVGDFVFGNLEYTDPTIIKEACDRGLKCMNVEQGYTRCSLLAVSDNALITADGSIAQVAKNEGLEVLFISSGSVFLPGERYGFIGGAGGRIEDKVILLGSIDTHPDSEEIKDFITHNSGKIISLAGKPLYDAGSLMCFFT
jgi:hypothetical protein